MKSLFMMIALLLPFCTQAQVKYVLPNEQVIFSFETNGGKKMVLARDTSDAYMIYRFGSRDKIEMEYPSKTKDSWKRFKYSYYLRGGEIDNAGMDLNYVYFDNNNIRYIVYDTYFAETNKYTIGVKIVLSDKKTIDIKGSRQTRKGSMVWLRDNDLVETGEELFD